MTAIQIVRRRYLAARIETIAFGLVIHLQRGLQMVRAGGAGITLVGFFLGYRLLAS